MTKVLGCDTSHWSGYTNAKVMYEQGIRFNIAKMTDFGSVSNAGFVDTRWTETYHNGKANGIIMGGYHWLQPFVDPTVQAKFYLEQYYKTPTDLPPVVDFEDARYSSTTDYLWRLQVWLDYVEKETKRVPIIYTGTEYGFMRPFTKTGWLVKYPLWLAHYTYFQMPPKVPSPWTNYTLWQYCENGDGRKYGTDSVALDMNYFNGSYDDLLKLCDQPAIPDVDVESPPPDNCLFQGTVLKTLNVRSAPSLSGTIIDQLPVGTRVNVYDISGLETWYNIGTNRWCAGKYYGDMIKIEK